MHRLIPIPTRHHAHTFVLHCTLVHVNVFEYFIVFCASRCL